jgi:hypothetical protein
MKATPSNGQEGTPDSFSGTVRSSIQTCDLKLCFIRALLNAPSLDQNISFIFAFFIAHFLLVENTYKNPYSLKAVKKTQVRAGTSPVRAQTALSLTRPYNMGYLVKYPFFVHRIGKKLIESSRTYAVKWQFLAKIPTFRHDGSIRYSRAKHAVYSYLGNRNTAHREYLMGSTVNNLMKF